MVRALEIGRVGRRLQGCIALACGLVPSLGVSGCYRYAYHERSPVGSHDLIAIDRQQVETHSAWSYWWGLQQSEWTPDPQQCDNNGAGRVEVGFRWFSVPLMLLTLGIAMPNQIVVFCNVDAGPGPGP